MLEMKYPESSWNQVLTFIFLILSSVCLFELIDTRDSLEKGFEESPTWYIYKLQVNSDALPHTFLLIAWSVSCIFAV